MQFLILSFVLFFVIIGFLVLNRMSSEGQKGSRRTAELRQHINQLVEKQEEIEKRLTNIEHIVTDSKFREPVEPRESINLKREVDELKILIDRLGKK